MKLKKKETKEVMNLIGCYKKQNKKENWKDNVKH